MSLPAKHEGQASPFLSLKFKETSVQLHNNYEIKVIDFHQVDAKAHQNLDHSATTL